MKPSSVHKIRVLLTTVLLLLFLFANIYTIRQIMSCGLELYFYEKMLVAYQVGGEPGIKKELETIISQDKAPREIALAKVFKNKLGNIHQLDRPLKDITENLKKKINLFRNLRNAAFGLILVIFLFQFLLNLSVRKNK